MQIQVNSKTGETKIKLTVRETQRLVEARSIAANLSLHGVEWASEVVKSIDALTSELNLEFVEVAKQ